MTPAGRSRPEAGSPPARPRRRGAPFPQAAARSRRRETRRTSTSRNSGVPSLKSLPRTQGRHFGDGAHGLRPCVRAGSGGEHGVDAGAASCRTAYTWWGCCTRRAGKKSLLQGVPSVSATMPASSAFAPGGRMRLTMEATVWYSKASLEAEVDEVFLLHAHDEAHGLSESPPTSQKLLVMPRSRRRANILPDGGDALFQFRHRADHGGGSFPPVALDHHVGEPVLSRLAARRARHFAEEPEVGRSCIRAVWRDGHAGPPRETRNRYGRPPA